MLIQEVTSLAEFELWAESDRKIFEKELKG